MPPRDVNSFVAIDPLALIFSTEIYLMLMEIKHPHVPLTEALAQLAKRTTVEDRKEVLARVKMMQENLAAVHAAFEKAG